MTIEFDRLIARESGGKQFGGAGSVAGTTEPTTSPKGAIGIAQVMPQTAKDVVTRMMGMAWTPDVEAKYKTDANFNRQIGETYFNHLKDRYKDDILATAAYNAGPGSVDKWLQQIGDPRGGDISHEMWAALIPYKETRDYVLSVAGGRADRLPTSTSAGGGDYGVNGFSGYSDLPLVNQPQSDAAFRPVEEQSQFSVTDALTAVFEETQTSSAITSALGKDWEYYTPEGGWTQEQVKAATSDVPKEYWDSIMSAPNPFYERQALLHQLDNAEKMRSLGWGAVPATIISTLLDPVTIGIGVSTGGIGAGALAARRGWLMSRLMQGTAAAAGNMAQEALIQSTKPISQWDQVVYSGLTGAGLGFAFGPSRAAVLKADNDALAKLATKYADHVAQGKDPDLFGKSSGGAAQVQFPDDIRMNTEEFDAVTDKGFSGPMGTEWMRLDATGQMRNSKNDLTRALGEQMGVDAVGNRNLNDLGQTFVASEKANLLERQVQVEWGTSLQKAVDDFYKRADIKAWEPWKKREAYNRLSDDAFLYLAGLKRSTDVDPASVAMGNAAAKIYSDFLQLAKDPSAFVGRNRPALPGFEDIAPNTNYVPFMHDFRKWREADRLYGSGTMEKFVKEGIMKALPEIEEAAAKRIAKGYLKTLHKIEAGMDTSYATALSGIDRSRMAELLKDGGVPQDDINALVEILTPKKGGEATSRAKARTPIEPSHSAKLYNRETNQWEDVKFTDFLHKDMDYLVRSYTRNLSGTLALHGVEIRGDDGKILIDGLSRRSDLDRAKNILQDYARRLQNRGEQISPADVTRDVENLEYMWEAVKGIPIKGSNTKAVMAFNTFRNVNFFRLMGNLGFAQLAEAGPVVYTMGWKAALRTMPVLRKLVQDVQSGKVDKAMMDELTYTFGAGTETIRHGSIHSWDDLGPMDGMYGRDSFWDGFWQKAQVGSTRLAQGLNKASLAPYVTNALQRWAGRGMYYRIGKWLDGAEQADTQLLRFMGIDDKMWKRIKAQDKYFTKGKNGELVFNFEKWTDREASSFLQSGILRMVRKTIQENDVGMLNRWFRKNPVLARLMLQFRTFSVGAWANHTLHQANRARNMGLLYGSLHAFHAISVGMMAAAVPYVARTYLQSIGRSDAEKFREERLSPEAVAKAAFQNSSLAAFSPMIADAPSALGLYDPIFSYRSSGQNSDPITGSPIGGLMMDSRDSIKALVNAATGEDRFSQRDARRLGGLFLPNLLPITMLYNSMISGLPEKDRSNR